ncbi:MAG: hypothetical protein PSX36_14470 [bacterium]|nr:hypothetical protein [bacterium]
MALNQNHTFEDLDGIKCSVVEKNCSPERVAFIKDLLEYNKFKVVVVGSPPAKIAPKPAVEGETAPPPPPPAPETFTVGVSDVSFNLINALFNGELLSKDGKIVNPNFWKQIARLPKEDDWYWKK